MLTAKVEHTDKLAGLKIGADDYICKPFDAMELVLRCEAILKRTTGNVTYGVWTTDPQRQLVKYKSQSIALSVLEFSLFELLIESPERIYSRDQIIALAYPDDRDITDRTVDSHVRKIRKKITQQGVEHCPIESVYGAGYRFKVSADS